MNKIIINFYDTVTVPIALLGYLWYLVIETPIFMGRTKAHIHLNEIAHRAEEEDEE